MLLDAALLYTQHYMVTIKGKVEQSRQKSSAHFYSLGVVANKKGALGVPIDYGPRVFYIRDSYDNFPDFFRMGI